MPAGRNFGYLLQKIKNKWISYFARRIHYTTYAIIFTLRFVNCCTGFSASRILVECAGKTLLGSCYSGLYRTVNRVAGNCCLIASSSRPPPPKEGNGHSMFAVTALDIFVSWKKRECERGRECEIYWERERNVRKRMREGMKRRMRKRMRTRKGMCSGDATLLHQYLNNLPTRKLPY